MEVSSAAAATDEPVFLAQRLHLVGVRRWQAGGALHGGCRGCRSRVGVAPDAAAAGRGLVVRGGSRLEVTDLELPEGFANLFVYDGGGGNVTLFAAPNDMTPVPARRWLTFRYRLRPSAERETPLLMLLPAERGRGVASLLTLALLAPPGRRWCAGPDHWVLRNAHLQCVLARSRGGLPVLVADAAGRVY